VRIETLDESISVITLFECGRLKPLRFLWRGRTVPIKHLASHWTTREGRDLTHFYSVSSNGSDYYEISFHTRTFEWMLNKVFLEG
jgi:hypothetical protein